MNLLIKIPTRERAQKFFQVLSKYQHMRTSANTRFLITLDENDKGNGGMNTEAARKVLSMWGNVSFVYGESKNKIDACNRDLNGFEFTDGWQWDVVLLASDDMIPQVNGYDDIILNDMTILYPDTDGVLQYNDGYTGDKIVALPVLGRKYYEQYKYIYHPDYISLWCDEEMAHVLKANGKGTYLSTVIIKHEHPMNNRSVQSDNSYRKTLAYYQQDKETFETRKAINFGITEQVKENVVKNKGGRPKKVTA